jgi:uncharacterized phiE125 gp8 family phage protein
MSLEGRLKLVTASTWEPVTVEEAKLFLRIEEEHVTEDPLIASLLKTARARYEQWTQRSVPRQTFDYYLDVPPEGAVTLPVSPLLSVSSIRGFTDTDATDTGGAAMNTTEFYVDVASEPGRVIALGGFTFPTATRIINSTIIRFDAGYSSGSSGVPDQAKTKIKQMVARAYEYRGDHSQQEIEALMDEVVRDELALPEWG